MNELTDYQRFISSDFSSFSNNKFICYCNDNSTPLLSHIFLNNKNTNQKPQNAVILIGPEGDFTEGEVAQALQKEFQGVSLGQSRLRTETAGVVACHTINLLNDL